MSTERVTKRKADEAVPDIAKEDAKKRARKDKDEGSGDEDYVAPAAAVESGDEDLDADELAALDKTNVIEGGRRTRGIRVDYSKLRAGEEDEDEEEDDEGEGEGEEDDADDDAEADEQADKDADGAADEEEAVEGAQERKENGAANGVAHETNGNKAAGAAAEA